MNEAALVRKNLFRKKVRAVLLTVSILIAFLIYGVLFSFYAGFTGGFGAVAADRLVTLNRISFTQTLPFAYRERIAQLDGVEATSHLNWFGGYYQDPRNQIQTFAVDPESYLEVYDELAVPDDQRQAFFATRDCALVGRGVMNQQGWELGQRIPLNSNIFQQEGGSSAWELDICAVFDAGQDDVPTNYVLMHYEYFSESTAFGGDELGWIVLRTGDPVRNDQVASQIDEMFANSPAETRTQTEEAFGEAFLAQLGNIALILVLVVGAAFATILMIVGTTMVMAVNERTTEIAVMKTLGFPAPRIFRMVLSESLLLSLFGGLIGIGIAAGLLTLMGAALRDFIPNLGMPLSVFLTALAFMIGLGLITGLIPAFIAMRVKIVDALGKI